MMNYGPNFYEDDKMYFVCKRDLSICRPRGHKYKRETGRSDWKLKVYGSSIQLESESKTKIIEIHVINSSAEKKKARSLAT